MIIQCPKCKTKFEIDENFIKNSEMKFQCSDCSYVWVEKFENSAVEQERQQENVIEKSVKQEQIPACLVSDNDVEKNTEKKSVFNTKNIMIVVLALFLFLVVFLLTQFVVQDFSSSNRSNSGFFRKSEEKKLDKNLL